MPRRFLTLLALMIAGSTHAATIGGRVVDSTGGALPGVTVTARPLSGHASVTATGADGAYAIDAPMAEYELTFQLLNFATVTRKGVRPPVAVDATLSPVASADVVVTARQTFRNLSDVNDPANDLIGFADAASVGVVTTAEIERRPYQRAGEILETIPGVVVSQHSGEGKANQYYLRGFNLDHGTDFRVTVAGLPVNLPTHGHGQGYADTNFLIPELISGVQFRKGPYAAEQGDFSTAGSANVNYLSILDSPLLVLQGGGWGYGRVLAAGSPETAGGYLLYAFEGVQNDGPWERPEDLRKTNGVLRYTRGGQQSGWSLTAMLYDAEWDATDQIPWRAVEVGDLSRFSLIDASDGGRTHRRSLSADWQRSGGRSLTQASAFVMDYRLQLFSNFTYFLDDPERGDQFEQLDDRRVSGAEVSHRWLSSVGSVSLENVAGVAVRHDDIAAVGLFHTQARRRLETIRLDSVAQTSGSFFAQSSVRWSPRVRTVLGVRADQYRFDLDTTGGRSDSIVSPRLSVVLGPWRNSELYLNAGTGFHSNDARTVSSDLLVRTRASEIGLRTKPNSRFYVSSSLWQLQLESELVFVGDAGTTESTRPSRRYGLEVESWLRMNRWLMLDADLAWSEAEFRDHHPAGSHIPGSIGKAASVGLSLVEYGRWSGSARYRYFGSRPLLEDNSERSHPSSLVNLRIGCALHPRVRAALDLFNVLDSAASDIDYFYTSRLPGEPEEGIGDRHFHPVEPRSARLSVALAF